MPTDTRPITERLREDTRDLHTLAEKGPLQEALVKGRLGREVYADVLEQMLIVHRALESALEAHRDSVPAIGRVVDPEQYRHAHIEADLRFYGRDTDRIGTVGATSDLVEHIERVARDEPLALLGLHYVLEGSNNGNRFIAKAVAQAYGLDGQDGLRTLLPYGERQPEVWARFKANLAACEFAETEMDTIVAAAKDIFRAIIDIHDELASRHADQPA